MNLKMEVYSPDLELLGILEIYRSLIFEECAFKSGSFSVESLITKDTLALLSPENILWIADDVAGIVEHIEESADDSGPYFTAKGRLLTGILDRRILWGAYNMYGSPDKIMRNLVTDCAIAPTRGDTEARKIPHLVLAGDSPTPASRLPAGYVELEYIQSTGTQYIDTEFVPKNTTKVASQFKLISASSHYFSIFGVEGSDGYKGYTIFGVDGQNNVQGIYWNQYFNVAGAAYSQTVPNSVEMGNGTITFDDVTQTFESSTFTCETSIYLFCNNKYSANGTSYPQYLCSAAIYNFSIYDSDNLVRDFVPCKNPAGTVGLYDLVGQKFYTNAGTGEFTAGPAVNLESYAASKSLSAIRKQKTGGSLQETLEEIGEANQVAYGVRLNAQIPQMEFWTRQGVDRTVSQSENEPVFYSTELDDVLSSEYFYDSSSYRNIALVAGEGEGADRMLVTVENTDESAPVPPSPPTPPTPPTPVTKYTITLSVDPQGSGVASGGGSVESGKSVTVTATATDGYIFTAWTEGGQTVSNDESYTFTVDRNRELVAVFAEMSVSRLPDGYTEVEYIESSGFTYIDTGIKPASAAVTIDFEPLAANTTTLYQYVIFSNYLPSSGTRYFFMLTWESSGLRVANATSTSAASFKKLSSDGTPRRMVAGIDYPNKKAFLVGEAELDLTSNATSASMSNIRLLGSTSAGGCVAAKLYSCQISTAGTLVRDFVPCVNPSGAAGLYDLVGSIFYANAGTGSFAAGPAI